MNLIQFSIRNPVTVTVGVLLVALFGIVSLLRLPIQLTPDVEKPEITVETTWRGASPQEVEREIIDEQEEQLKGVESLEKMTSESQYGQGRIILRFPAGTNIDTALLQVSNRLNQVKEYPTEVDEPVILSANNQGSAMAWFIFEAVEGNSIDIETMRDFVEDVVKPRFERVRGVASSNVYGGREREVRVVVDPSKLAARSITMVELAQSLDAENRNYSAGDFDEGKRSYVVRTVGEYRSTQEVEDVVVTVRGGKPVYVGDIATVRLDYQDPSHVVREMGRTAIAVNAVRETGANVLDAMSGLRRAVQNLNEDILNPLGFKLYQVYDETDYVYSSLSLVRQNLIIGSLLAVAVLFLFLRTGSSTLVIGLAIPISIMGTFIMLWVLGRNLNVVSLAGMTFAAGMLVDNSIVVLENIYRHRQEGKPLLRAAYDATAEVWGAILASTLTTIAVFVPIIFIEEQAGQLFRDIAIAIAAGVGLSLITSITVIPALSARVLKTVAEKTEGDGQWRKGAGAPSTWLDSQIDGLKRRGVSAEGVGQFVYWLCGSTIRRLAVVVGFTALAILLSWAMLPKAEYLPEGNRNLLIGILLPPPGYSIEQLTSLATTIEGHLKPHWEANLRSPEEAALDGPAIENFFYVARGRTVFMGARTKDPEVVRDLFPVLYRATADLPGVISVVTQRGLFERGLGEGRSIDIEITGPEIERLIDLGKQIFGQTRSLIAGAQVRPMPSLDLGSPELQVNIRRDRSADVQLTNRDLGFTIDALVDGAKASDFQFEGDEIDLTVRGQDGATARTQDLENMPIYTPAGRLTTVGAVADVVLVAGPEQINHIERERAIVIRVIPPLEIPLEDAMNLIDTNIITPLKQGGTMGRLYNVRLAGTADDLTLTYDALKGNLLLALIITFLLMAALFESFLYPFVIIFTVPLAALGGFLGLRMVNTFVTYQALDVLTMLGFIILIGVVVNNAILIVHQSLNFMQLRRRSARELNVPDGQPMPARQAISEAVRTRVRPILMSTLTTMFGLMPLVLASGPGSELYRGIGSVVLGGLAVSTVFTLVVVPALFSLVMDTRQKPTEQVVQREEPVPTGVGEG